MSGISGRKGSSAIERSNLSNGLSLFKRTAHDVDIEDWDWTATVPKFRAANWVNEDYGKHPMSLEERHRNLRLGASVEADYNNSLLAQFIFHPRFETFGGCVVLFNFIILTLETHAAAIEDDSLQTSARLFNTLLLVYYTVEGIVRLYVMKWKYFQSMWNNLDVVIIVTGWLSELLSMLDAGASGVEQIAMLKSLRMLRLLRLVRLLVAFRELYVLVAGIGRCMKTLFWASGLIFLVSNAWAILSVEFLDEKVKGLVPTGVFKTCSWCPTAFANVWYANLTWFQIISTADWVPVGRPLAEEFFWTYTFFVLNVFVVMWGLLNLIVAAIVDANLAARDDDVAIAARMAAQTQSEAWSSFAGLCKEMDKDGSGDITIAEFKEFWKTNIELQQHLTIMGVQEKDMDRLLMVMDEDGSGTLEHKEFIEQFTQMRTLVEKTTLYFLMRFVQDIQSHLLDQSDNVERIRKEVAKISSACGSTATPAAMNESDGATAQTNAHRKESEAVPLMKPVKQKMPHGWYYFGSSLPAEAYLWCRDADVACEAVEPQTRRGPASNQRPSPRQFAAENDEIHRTEVIDASLPASNGPHWEPVPPQSYVPLLPNSIGNASPEDVPEHDLHSVADNLVQSRAPAASREHSQEPRHEFHDPPAMIPRHGGRAWCSDNNNKEGKLDADLSSGSMKHLP